ncbi:MAG: hypothetical protein JWM95_1062 [Gemmatimonadetes bacterium]|nr:hypothetical protein [Gemmatimonadota bacterium]
MTTRLAMRARALRVLGIVGLAGIVVNGCTPAPADADTSERHASAPAFVAGDITGDAGAQLQAAGVRGPAVIIVVDSLIISNCEDLARQLREVLHSRLARNRPSVVLTRTDDSVRIATWLRQERIPSENVVTYRKALVVGDKPVRGAAVLILDARLHVASGVSHPVTVLNTRPQSFAMELNAQ